MKCLLIVLSGIFLGITLLFLYCTLKISSMTDNIE